MTYYSLNHRSAPVDFRSAVLQGQAPDGGLYFPSDIPIWDQHFIDSLANLNKIEIGFRIMEPYVGESMRKEDLYAAIASTLSFDFPLKQISERIWGLELFHGPTLAFKDLGARFFSKCLELFVQAEDKKTIVLVATSGDTGGAVADAFYRMKGIEVVILYPAGRVSSIQEMQLTGYQGNIHALEIKGSFDECQQLVKQAFVDRELSESVRLTSSNSINIARWLSQQVYYGIARSQWMETVDPVIAVPSGNLGNICAGMMAHHSGLPIDHFIMSCNVNNVFVKSVSNLQYHPQPSLHTLSNAMDVGNPSNAVRIMELLKQKKDGMVSNAVVGYSVSDDQTSQTIKEVFNAYNYLLDPHSAVAYSSMNHYLNLHPRKKGIVLCTAHPVKFPESIEDLIDQSIPIPPAAASLFNRKKEFDALDADFAALKEKIFELV